MWATIRPAHGAAASTVILDSAGGAFGYCQEETFCSCLVCNRLAHRSQRAGDAAAPTASTSTDDKEERERDPSDPLGARAVRVRLVVRTTPTAWQTRCVELVQQAYDPTTQSFAADLPKRIASDPVLRRVAKRAMALAMTLRERKDFTVALSDIARRRLFVRV
jgi:hypothetical protein